MLDIGRQIAAVHLDEDVRPALSPSRLIVGQPSTQDERGTRFHGREGHRDRLALTYAGVEQHRSAITAQLGRAAGNGHKVLESLFDRPIVSVSDVQKMTSTTYAAANGLVSRLMKLNVLSEMTGYARNRRFRYAPYIALFNDMGPGEDSPQGGI